MPIYKVKHTKETVEQVITRLTLRNEFLEKRHQDLLESKGKLIGKVRKLEGLNNNEDR